MQQALLALLSRKFLIALLAVVLGVFFVPAEPSAKLDFLKWVVGLFAAANVVQKATSKE